MFQSPPPVFLGGAQPYAAQSLVPVSVSMPPVITAHLARAQENILAAWQDTVWTVIEVDAIAQQEGSSMSNPTNFTWTDPTTNLDGTPIASGEITGYQVGVRSESAVGSVPGTYPILSPVVAGATATSEALAAIVPALVAGSYACAVMAIGPIDSAWSSEATFAISETPSAPSGLKVS